VQLDPPPDRGLAAGKGDLEDELFGEVANESTWHRRVRIPAIRGRSTGFPPAAITFGDDGGTLVVPQKRIPWSELNPTGRLIRFL
jgi:hypothetical protein